jgi:hypothetical protein
MSAMRSPIFEASAAVSSDMARRPALVAPSASTRRRAGSATMVMSRARAARPARRSSEACMGFTG